MREWFDELPELGMLLSPIGWRKPWCPLYACDNDAFANRGDSGWWDREGESRWLKMLDKVSAQEHKPVFVLLPDVVGDWDRTIERAWSYRSRVTERRLTPALALQDGCRVEQARTIPVDWWFIGGSREWKWSDGINLVSDGHHLGRKVHIGRVGGLSTLQKAYCSGADSCDGSTWQRFSRREMPILRDFLKGVRNGEGREDGNCLR